MNYDNFESLINPSILDRGRNYFAIGVVTSLKEEDDTWRAEVAGSKVYEVRITGTKKIKDWYCNCPYDEGPICKHIVAVLYSIQEQKFNSMMSQQKKAQ